MNVALRSQPLNLISLCTGGGGLDLGVELAMPGTRSVVLMEREAFAIAQLVSAIRQGLLAEAAIWSDVTTFDGRPWRGLVDGVIGGIPCQPHSLAGKRQGSHDERDLWSDARRIIVQSGAWFVLIENVAGMLSAKPGLDPGALRVRRDLSRLGFDVEAGLFTAAEVGASHERERVFILAVANPDRRFRPWRPAIWDQADGRWSYAQPAGPSAGLPVELANAGRCGDQRWRGAGDIPCEARTPEGEGHQRQRDGNAAGDGGEILADAQPGRSEGWSVGQRDCSLGRDDAEPRDGRDTCLCSGAAMGNTARRDGACAGQSEADHGSPRQRQPRGPISLFPPGPSDLRSWAGLLASAPELEPAFRRVADGLASRLDVARVDRLRMLGNGVVSLQAAFAFRTLCSRLASNGNHHLWKHCLQ